MDIKFDANGLVPVVTQCASSGKVLMLAYANQEAVDKTMATGFAHYYSRSRKQLWKKGETSGHLQHVLSVALDCDGDALLYTVKQDGAACHTGEASCFFNTLFGEAPANASALYEDVEVIKERRSNPVEGSYVNYLLDKGVDKICKKIAEEAGEVIIAAKTEGNTGLSGELADLYFHTLVLAECLGMSIDEVFAVLADRRKKPRVREYKG